MARLGSFRTTVRRAAQPPPSPWVRHSLDETQAGRHLESLSLYSSSDALHGVAIAAAVGSILAAINLGPTTVLRPWDFPAETLRLGLDYLAPFLVASLGAVLANRKTRAALRERETYAART